MPLLAPRVSGAQRFEGQHQDKHTGEQPRDIAKQVACHSGCIQSQHPAYAERIDHRGQAASHYNVPPIGRFTVGNLKVEPRFRQEPKARCSTYYA